MKQNSASLRSDLVKIARNIRKCVIPLSQSLTQPQSVRDDQVILGGKLLKRKRIVLLAPACSTATCTMCPLPNEAIDTHKRSFDQKNLILQFDRAVASENDVDVVTVYCNGNFFADKEISPMVRDHIYSVISSSKASYVVVESLPNFINEEKITIAKELLGHKTLVVSMGLQSSNDTIREIAINTVCTKPAFERSVSLLMNNDFIPLVFLMVKPPFLSEREAISDTVTSWRYVNNLGIREVMINPTKVTKYTVAHMLYDKGDYKPPKLWTTIEILKQIYSQKLYQMPIIATSVLSKTIFDTECSNNCQSCTSRLIKLFTDYNLTRNTEKLFSFRCNCRALYEKEMENQSDVIIPSVIKQRVTNFVSSNK